MQYINVYVRYRDSHLEAEVVEKFDKLVKHVFPARQVAEIRDTVLGLDKIDDAAKLAKLLDKTTIAESGLAGYEVNSWSGLIGPAGMPKEAISRLHAEVVHVMGLPEVKSRLPNLGLEASTNTPEEFGAYLLADIVKWARVVRESGAHGQ